MGEHGSGVIEFDRAAGIRLRHRRTSGDSWWVRIACSRDEGIALPFDDVSVRLCPDCWEVPDESA
jgi:hypothetical protein